jgi:hypothetical protein
MGVVAVYALNDEFKSVVREVKNGMVSPLTYVVAKSLLVLPIMVIFALFALVLPAYVIMDFPWDTFGLAVAIWSSCIFAHECLAEWYVMARKLTNCDCCNLSLLTLYIIYQSLGLV